MTEVKLDLDGLEAVLNAVLPVSITETPDYAEMTFGTSRSKAMTVEPAIFLVLNQLPDLLALAREAEGLREALWAGVEHFERVDGDAAHKAVIAQMVAAAAPSRTQSGEDAA